MPFSKVHVPEHIPATTTRALAELLHQSLVDTCGVNPDDNFCLVNRYTVEDMVIHPTFLGERSPNDTVTIEISLLKGRSNEQKEHFYKDLRQRLKTIDIKPSNVIVYLLENEAIDWSFSEAGSVKTVLNLE